MHWLSRAGKGPSNNHNYTRRRPFAYELRGAYGRTFTTEVALAEPLAERLIGTRTASDGF